MTFIAKYKINNKRTNRTYVYLDKIGLLGLIILERSLEEKNHRERLQWEMRVFNISQKTIDQGCNLYKKIIKRN